MLFITNICSEVQISVFYTPVSANVYYTVLFLVMH